MANISAIKRRIKSAGNISQITRAMQMVAASKMKKAQAAAIAGKPYADKIHRAVAIFSQSVDQGQHSLFRRYERAEKTLCILISTNKGLCGGLNSNLFRDMLQRFNNRKIVYVTLGKKGRSFVRRSGGELLADFSDKPFLEEVPAVIALVVQEFKKTTYTEVVISYNTFVSSFQYDPSLLKILPLELSMIEEVKEKGLKEEEGRKDQDEMKGELLVEPSYQSVLESLIPHFLETQIRHAILEAEASEHSARMIAMKNATDNADQLREELTLEYNKIRQQQITYEIADMVTARMAVE